MPRKPLTPMQSASLDHPTQATRAKRDENDVLRDNGFKIHSRPNHGEPVWCRVSDGILFLEEAALRQCGISDDDGEYFRGAEPCCLGDELDGND